MNRPPSNVNRPPSNVNRPPMGTRAPKRRGIDVRIPRSTIVRVLLAILVVAIAMRMWLAFLLFLVSVLFAVTLDPAVRWFERRGLRRVTGVLAVAIVLISVVTAGIVVVVPPLAQEIGVLVGNFSETRAHIIRDFPDDSPIFKAFITQVLELPDSPEVRKWMATPLVWAELALGIVAGGIVVLMLSLYLLVDGQRAYTWLLSYVPRRHRPRVAETVPAVTEVVRSYVRGQFITSVLCGTFLFILLTILGVPAALPMAVAAAVLDVLPILGTIAMTVPTTLLALTVSPLTAVIVFDGV